MLALRNPNEAYRRVDFDARIEGASPAQLVALCFEQAKSKAMTKALAAITALQLGVSGKRDVADSLRQFYGAARRTLLDCALNFDAGTIAAMSRDLRDIAGAMIGAKTDS